jgi:ferric-dicitrate binding protein FerR (iron transport regulator)
MIGQNKALILAAIGIVAVLLAGLTGTDLPRTRQANTAVAETRAITLEDRSRHELDTAFRADADTAAREMGLSIAADLTVELKHKPSVAIAQNLLGKYDRG